MYEKCVDLLFNAEEEVAVGRADLAYTFEGWNKRTESGMHVGRKDRFSFEMNVVCSIFAAMASRQQTDAQSSHTGRVATCQWSSPRWETQYLLSLRRSIAGLPET